MGLGHTNPVVTYSSWRRCQPWPGHFAWRHIGKDCTCVCLPSVARLPFLWEDQWLRDGPLLQPFAVQKHFRSYLATADHNLTAPWIGGNWSGAGAFSGVGSRCLTIPYMKMEIKRGHQQPVRSTSFFRKNSIVFTCPKCISRYGLSPHLVDSNDNSSYHDGLKHQLLKHAFTVLLYVNRCNNSCNDAKIQLLIFCG